MAFTSASNFAKVFAAQSTIAQLRMTPLLNRMNGAYDGDAMTAETVYAQHPIYAGITADDTQAAKAAWGTPEEAKAARIAIDMTVRLRSEAMLYVEDEEVNAIRNYRSRYGEKQQNAMATKAEDNLVTYIRQLSTNANTPDIDDSANGNAGKIALIADTTTNGFSATTGRPTGTAAQMTATRKSVSDFLQTSRVSLKRLNLEAGGGSGIGGSYSQFWAVFPPEVYAYGLTEHLESLGIDLEFSVQAIRDIGVFGPAFMGTYKGFDLFTANALSIPTSGNAWDAYVGTNQAIAAPRRPMNMYITSPANASAERWEFRLTQRMGRQLINSQLLIKGTWRRQT